MWDHILTPEREIWVFRGARVIEFIAVIFALVAFFIDHGVRTEERAARAEERLARMWNLATDPRPGNSGKIPALEFLNREQKPLAGISIPKAYLVGVELKDANLRGANLSEANLNEANLQGANLIGAELQSANLRGANLQGANLIGAKLQGADLSGAELQGADLSKAKLQGADLRQAKLRGADLRGAELQDAILRWAELQGADLRGAELQGADLSEAKLQGADLRWAKLQGADLIRAKLQGADLSVAELQGALFWGASLGGARLVDVDLRAAYLWGIDFKKFTPDEWTKLKDEIAAAVPAGEMRKNALENIYKAMKSETDIRPKSAEGAIYDPSVPELADQLKQWPPLDEDAYWPFELRLGILTGIACDDNKYTAVGIARRARRTEPFDDPHLAGALLEQECLAIQVLPENLKAKLREAAEGPDKP
ncbi:MAG TPA: pentapeptide repeat-containing protein [Rhodospirillaceae bacterium]|nr:pentapeptide repeat-containing protein [Rhodospirillaceae bacterium]